ncbi:MAG: response regulator [Bacteroidota bacterium]
MESPKIILIEDSEADSKLFKLVLDLSGYRGIFAHFKEASEYLSMIQTLDDTAQIPDLIFIDYNIPQHNGIELLHQTRRNPFFQQVPVILLSGHDPEYLNDLKGINAPDMWLEKPFEFSLFKENLQTAFDTYLPSYAFS